MWTITPEAAAFGQTGESRVTALVGRYFDGTSNLTIVRPASLPASPQAEIRNLTVRGTLTLAQA